MTIKTIPAKQARDNFSDLLGAVYYGKEAVVVEKKGKPVAVVINPEEYNRYRKAARERFFETVDDVQAKNIHKNVTEVLEDITRMVETVRQDRYESSK